MATRRSSRLQNPPQAPVNDKQDVLPVKTGAEKKGQPKPPAEKPTAKSGVVKRPAKAVSIRRTTQKAQPMPPAATTGAKISLLPPEVMKMVLDNITEQSTMSALGRTSKTFYSLMMPRLYGRIAVAAMFHAHIPKLIRTIEPHLTIAQKKQLKKEGTYKGQQERYASGLDQKAIPICAGYVRQLVVGVSDPGKKHRYICDRYVEEALKNMVNLRIVETRVLSESISKSLASLTKLKAMRLFIDTGFHENNVNAGEVLLPLAEIKNLKHLELHDHSCSSNNHLVTQSMIRNSKSTLQSLTLVNCRYGAHFLKDWEKNSRATTGAETAVIHTDRKGHDFTALKCLHLSSMSVDKNFVKEFERAFDFSRLRELELSDIIDPELLFYPFLTSLVTSYIGTTDISLSLRTLSLTMTDVRDFVSSRNTHEQKTASFEAKSRFLSSFDTLTTLVLRDYGLYSPQANANPGLSDVLLRAILKHKNLKVLRIPYNGVSSDEKIPYLSAATIGELVDGLPQLREIEFAPDEQQMEGIAKSLCRGSHIESVACFPYDSWSSYPPPDNPGFSILGPLLSAFLSNPKINLPPSSASKRFVWEDHYKLQRVRAAHNEWEVASKFGKRKINSGKNGGHFRTKEFKTEADGETREVLYRIIHKVFRVHVGYDDDFGWVSKADLELQ